MAKKFLPVAALLIALVGCNLVDRQEARKPYGFVVTDTGLSNMAAEKMPDLLASIGLPDLAEFEEVAGPRKFDHALCETVRQRFASLQDQPMESDPCQRAAQQASITNDSIPISFRINELESQHLVLEIRNRTGQEKLFTFQYHMPTGTLDAEQ